MAAHSSVPAQRTPWTEEPGSLYSSWGCREWDRNVRLSLSLSFTFTFFHFHFLSLSLMQKFCLFLYLWICLACRLVKVQDVGNGSSLLLLHLPEYQGRSIFLSVNWLCSFHFFVAWSFRLWLTFLLGFDLSISGLQALFLFSQMILLKYHSKWFCLGYSLKFLTFILVVFLMASLFYLCPREANFALRLSTKNNIF